MFPKTFKVIKHNFESPWTYEDLDWYQNQIKDSLLNSASASGAKKVAQDLGLVIFSEVASVITVGRRTPKSDVVVHLANQSQIELLDVKRGGLATYHGEGQWICFIIDTLENLTGDKKGVRIFVDRFLKATGHLVQHFGLEPECRSGAELGVWVGGKKLGALGIEIKKGVVLHGMSLNVFRTEHSFLALRPCGLGLPVGYLSEELLKINKTIDFDEVPRLWMKCLSAVFVD